VVETPVVEDTAKHEEAIRAESRRRKEEAKAREREETRRLREEKNSWWNWIRGR
jgi:hypothetical protein